MKIIALTILLTIMSCSLRPSGFSVTLEPSDLLIRECPCHYRTLRKELRKHSAKPCYYVRQKFIENGMKEVIDSCFLDLRMSEVVNTIGIPTSMTPATDSIYYRFDIYRYSITSSGRCKYPEWNLVFSVDPLTDTIFEISRLQTIVVN